MRIQIAEFGIGGRDESWYYLEFNEKDGEFYLVKEWNNLSLNSLRSDSGEERMTLREAAQNGHRQYHLAIQIIKKRLFSTKISD